MNKNIKILVCVHKKHHIRNDNLYLPIHAGKALANFDLGFQGDDTGNNISKKNPYYCELTVQYWAWKNIENLDYIGLCHYRRFFNLSSIKIKNVMEFDKVFRKYDIILPSSSYTPYSNMFHLTEGTTREDIYILINVICVHYPTYKQTALDYLYNSNGWIGCNMFITSKERFDKYSKWLFDVLLIVEKNVKMAQYSRLKRILAYMGEVLLPIYCIHNQFKIKYCDICENPDATKNYFYKRFIHYNLNKIRYKICFKLIQPFKIKKIVFPDSTLLEFKDNSNYNIT
jgi:hypothetical protein